MFGLKKQLIKNMIKYKIIEDAKGELTIEVLAKDTIPDEYKIYEKYVLDLIKILPGIEEIAGDYVNNKIKIYYDADELTPRQIAGWANILIDVTIDYLDVIKEYGETEPAKVAHAMKETLMKKIKALGIKL